jgi:hypothetical protein
MMVENGKFLNGIGIFLNRSELEAPFRIRLPYRAVDSLNSSGDDPSESVSLVEPAEKAEKLADVMSSVVFLFWFSATLSLGVLELAS